jgi:hypothetical protein
MSKVFITAARSGALLVTLVGGAAGVASAQVTPAAGYTPPDDTPAIRVGATIFADYTVQQQPKVTADGQQVTLNQFNVGRSYINVTGNISHNIAFRITPDIVRETTAGSALNGSLTFRLKYAYGQWNLDDHMTRGSWARFGIQQTPWVDFMEGIYRYRFQGTIFEDREGFLSSSDAGASFHYNLPKNYGDIHSGFYNGENYNKAEVNDQKGWMTRATFRPLATSSLLAARGLRVTGFWDKDAFVKDAPRERGIAAVTFEHKYLNASYDALWFTNQTTSTATRTKGTGFSAWVTPKYALVSKPGASIEGLFRYDSLKPNKNFGSQKKNRTIAGVAYWFPHQGAVTTALLFDVDNTTFENFTTPQVNQRLIAVHALINF